MKMEIKDLKFSYDSLTVLENLSFNLEKERITCILGPSGCGKTTLLNILSGVLDAGEGMVCGAVPGEAAYLFQEPRLLPWKTIYNNIDLVLKNHFAPSRRKDLISELLKLVELDEFSDYYPHKLSGGMRQRASLARAFAYPSNLLFMDEPFQALDPALKLNLIDDFLKLWQKNRKTCLLVTHNIQEAALLGDHILVLSRRPSRLTAEFRNNLDHNLRIPYSSEILKLEHELYTALVSSGD
ncbi:MAG: ATP-binding cassette domain-containing protein [Spirochaetales bacterium]|nr:ATP-binding cassette domain-containing protein [Spirochaetales bacterium]